MTLAADDHRHGWSADSALADLTMLIVYGGAFVFFTFLQMTSTEDSVFGLLQVQVDTPPSATPSQIQAAYNGTLDRNHLIAFAIALSVQLFLMTLAFPSARALLLSHLKSKLPTSASVGNEAEKMARWQSIIARILIVADILTDFLYVLSGHVVFSGTILGIIPSPNAGGIGILLVGVVYPIAVCGATLFFGNIAFKRLGAFIHRIHANLK